MSFLPYFLLSLVIIFTVLTLLRLRYLSEKYVLLWLVLGFMIMILAAFPSLLFYFSSLFGVQSPANLLFTLAIILLLGVSLHLSVAITKVEDKTRILAEEIAMLKLEIESQDDIRNKNS